MKYSEMNKNLIDLPIAFKSFLRLAGRVRKKPERTRRRSYENDLRALRTREINKLEFYGKTALKRL